MPPATHDAIRPPLTKEEKFASYRHFVVGAIVYLLLCQSMILFRTLHVGAAGLADFRSFYAAGMMVRTGHAHQLYDLAEQEKIQSLTIARPGVLPFIYPAYSTLLFIPLSLLSWRAAFYVFFGMNLVLLGISARLMRDSLPNLAELWRALPLALFFAFVPVALALYMGQTSIILLALYCAAFSSLQKDKRLRAGMFLGLAIFKVQIAAPVALVFLLGRRWRFIAGFLAGAGVSLAESLLVTGPLAFVQYWRALFLTAISASGEISRFQLPPATMPNLYGFGLQLTGSTDWGARVGAALSILVFLWVAIRRPSLPTALIAGLLISRYLGMHDLVLLLVPLTLALDHYVAHPQQLRDQVTAVVCCILLLPPMYTYVVQHNAVPLLVVPMLALLFCFSRPEPSPATVQ